MSPFSPSSLAGEWTLQEKGQPDGLHGGPGGIATACLLLSWFVAVPLWLVTWLMAGNPWGKGMVVT